MLSCALFVCVAFVSSAVQGAKREPFRLVMSMRALGPRSMSYELHSVPIDVGPRLTSLSGGCCSCFTNPASHSASPGVKWAVSSGASALLGYCWKAPLDNQGSTQILDDWCGQRSALGDIEAWMRANDCRCGHNACAIHRVDEAHLEYTYFRRVPIIRTYVRETVSMEK